MNQEQRSTADRIMAAADRQIWVTLRKEGIHCYPAAATNPGVWVHALHDLMRRSKFTDWSQYEKDQVIE